MTAYEQLASDFEMVVKDRDRLQLKLAYVFERAEKAKALDAQARVDFERLTRELEEARSFHFNFEHASKLEREMLTGELEAERSGAPAMREALEAQLSARGTDCQCNACQLTRKALSSTAGAEYLATMAAYRDALERSGCACRTGNVELGESPYKCLRCVTLESHTAGAEMLERLRKLEATDSERQDACYASGFNDCKETIWTVLEKRGISGEPELEVAPVVEHLLDIGKQRIAELEERLRKAEARLRQFEPEGRPHDCDCFGLHREGNACASELPGPRKEATTLTERIATLEAALKEAQEAIGNLD